MLDCQIRSHGELTVFRSSAGSAAARVAELQTQGLGAVNQPLLEHINSCKWLNLADLGKQMIANMAKSSKSI